MTAVLIFLGALSITQSPRQLCICYYKKLYAKHKTKALKRSIFYLSTIDTVDTVFYDYAAAVVTYYRSFYQEFMSA